MTHGSNFAMQWICVVCGGAEESAPGCEPPSPPICHTCDRLNVLDALTVLGVAL